MKNYKNLTIQFPINIIDHRWNNINIKKLKIKSKSFLVARSVFLRGKLLSNDKFKNDNKINKLLKSKLVEIKSKFQIKSNLELCVRFINSLNYLDNVGFGFEKYDHILQTIKFKNKKFSKRIIFNINKQFRFTILNI